MIQPKFPTGRPRRLRRTPWIRRLVGENQLSVDDLIFPMFITDGTDGAEAVRTLPGIFRHGISSAVDMAEECARLGIPVIALFPYVEASQKTDDCREATNPDNLVNRATRAIKRAVPDIGIMLDVALDPYNPTGHDGLLEGDSILNDETVEILVRQALVQAESGADILGPSDMMDGRIGAIRSALDSAGHVETSLMAYTAKYASVFYGPFREAVGSSGALVGDKRTYQMDPPNADEALRMAARDLEEGADMIMVKPGMPYLDICSLLKSTFRAPTFAYQVSGEYGMIMSGHRQGHFDLEAAIIESLCSFKRAGCDGILTYFAMRAAILLADSDRNRR